MLVAVSAIAIVDATAKYLSEWLHGLLVAWGYFVAMLLWLLLGALVRPHLVSGLLISQRPLLQVARALCLVLSLGCLFFSLTYLPLAEATTIGFTAPLFVVALSGPMLGERVGARRWLAVALGMLGALIVARPGTDALHWSALITLAGAFFFAQFNIVTRMLGPSERTATTLLYTFTVGAIALSLVAPLVWSPIAPWQCAVLLGAGALGTLAHFAFVRALSQADASLLATLNYTRLLWAIAIGVVVFGDVPDRYTLLGGTITITSGLYVIWLAMRRP